jgi:glucose dehydrogenase
MSPMVATANEELLKMQGNPKDWAMPTGNYANWRYSELKQITKANVKNLQVSWTFSTGVLRGHEGGPLVIGDVMYVHTPFPNIVYALDLNDYPSPGRHDGSGARCQDRQGSLEGRQRRREEG